MADIITMAGRFKSITELKSFCEAQYLALKSSVDRIKQLEEEIKHLQDLLKSTVPVISNESEVQTIIVSPEQAILEAQIKLIHDRGLGRELTLEETKRLDLLLKNLYLIKGSATGIIASEGKTIDKKLISDAQLVQIASIDQN